MHWLKSSLGSSLIGLTTSHVCQMYIRPRTSLSHGSVAQALMTHADTSHYVGLATWFISHTWSNSFSDTLESILLYFEKRDDSEQAKVWVDILVTPQHASTGPSKPSTWWMSTFRSNIGRIGKLLLVVDVWNNPTALRRAW